MNIQIEVFRSYLDFTLWSNAGIEHIQPHPNLEIVNRFYSRLCGRPMEIASHDSIKAFFASKGIFFLVCRESEIIGIAVLVSIVWTNDVKGSYEIAIEPAYFQEAVKAVRVEIVREAKQLGMFGVIAAEPLFAAA